MRQFTEEDGTIVVVLDDKTEFAYKPGTSQAEIDADLQRAAPKTSGFLGGAKDVGLSALSAVPKAVTGLAGMLPDMANMAKAGREKLASYLPEGAQAFSRAIPNPYEMLFGAGAGSQDLRGVVEQATGPLYEPQTAAGRATDIVTQGAVGMGRNVLTQPMLAAKLLGAQAGGAELAGQVSNQNPWARAAGGMVASAPWMLGNRAQSAMGKRVRESIGEPTPQEIAAAQGMQGEGVRQGIPLTGFESFDRGHELGSYLLSSPTGNPIYRDFLKPRPQQVRAAVEREIIGPTGPRATPQVNASRAEEAATNALVRQERGVSAQTSPLYQASKTESVPVKEIEALVNRARALAATDKTGIVAPAIDDFVNRLTLSPGSPGAPGTPGKMTASGWQAGTPAVPATPPTYITDIPNLDRLRKFTRDKVDLPPVAAEAIPKETGRQLATVNKDLKTLMEQNAPNWSAGRQMHQDLTRQNVEPLLRSDVGKVAGRGYDPQQFPAIDRIEGVLTSPNARPETIRTVYTALNREDKQAFPGMVQTVLENKLKAAGKDLMEGPNVNVGAKFRNAVAGSVDERANFNEMMRGVALANGANPGTFTKGVNNLLDVLERTGRTPGRGSQTEPRQQFTQGARASKTADVMEAVSTEPLRSGANRIRDWTQRKSNRELTKIITSPDAVEKLVELAKYKPDTMTARWLVVQILGIQDAAQEE